MRNAIAWSCAALSSIVLGCLPSEAATILNQRGENLKTHEQRVILAKEIRNYFSEIRDQIPNLRPQDEEWLQKEQTRINSIEDNGRSARELQKLSESREYRIRVARSSFAPIITQIDRIINQEYLKGTNSNLAQNSSHELELVEWLNLTESVLAGEPSQKLWSLIKGGHADITFSIGVSRYDGPYLMPHFGTPERIIPEAINTWILKPYLMGKTKSY